MGPHRLEVSFHCERLLAWRNGQLRYALIAVPILMATLDLVENGCIAVMLWTWPDLSHGLVEVSSVATRVKIMAGVLTEALMGALAVIWLMRWGVGRRA
jgi:hypothetical protein